MASSPPTPIDVTRYLTVPRGSVPRIISLCALTLKHAPDQRSEDLDYRYAQLDEVTRRARESVRVRYLELGPNVAARLAAHDEFVGALDRVRSERLAHWQVLACPAVEHLAEHQRKHGREADEVDYVELLALAREAADLHALVFPTGLDYTRLAYDEQAEHMRTVAAVVEEQGCGEALHALIGPLLAAVFNDASRRYDAMIEQRAAQRRGSQVDLRAIYSDLTAALQGYVISLLSMYRPDDADNVAMIRRALRPIDALREQIAIERAAATRSGVRAGAEPTAADEVGDATQTEVEPEAIDELLAHEQATARELGLDAVASDDDGDGEAAEPARLDA